MLTTESINEEKPSEFVPGVIPADFASLHWSQRRKLVEINGGVWTNAEDAHQFLSGLLGVPVEIETPAESITAPAQPAVVTSTQKFDINRGYIHNIGDDGQYYVQDGCKFGTNGLYIGNA